MKKIVLVGISVLFVVILVVLAALFPKLQEDYETENTIAADSETEEVTEKKNTAAATDFTVYDKDGNPVHLSDFVGKPTVVNFWATWCGYCVRELPDFNALYEEYKDRVNFVMVDLTDGYRETQTDALAFVQQQGYTFPVYFDTDYSAAEGYAITGIPVTLLIDGEGNLYQTHQGMMTETALRNALQALTEDAD